MHLRCHRYGAGYNEEATRELPVRIHILGICGTFMGGLAQLCRANGWEVNGSDEAVYPPMSDQLRKAGINLNQGYDPEVFDESLDLVVIGNVMSRGNPSVETLLNRKIPFISGPELLGRLTANMKVLAVAGTHGKTTTSSMLAWILEVSGLNPGFLIGGVPENFGVSARLGGGSVFVVEADEYDTAFFDKRSKFVHYHPDVFGINNLEFDHEDIFPDLASIETQFHHAIRRVPSEGFVVVRKGVAAIDRVLSRGLWSQQIDVGIGASISFRAKGTDLINLATGTSVSWGLLGTHNAANAELAAGMAQTLGVPIEASLSALGCFTGVARRLSQLYNDGDLVIWDDFAHHPTAIASTLQALRAEILEGPLIAVIELRSNTMKGGRHIAALMQAVNQADQVIWVIPRNLDWDAGQLLRRDGSTEINVEPLSLVESLAKICQGQLVFMSNGGFSGLQNRVVERLRSH